MKKSNVTEVDVKTDLYLKKYNPNKFISKIYTSKTPKKGEEQTEAFSLVSKEGQAEAWRGSVTAERDTP